MMVRSARITRFSARFSARFSVRFSVRYGARAVARCALMLAVVAGGWSAAAHAQEKVSIASLDTDNSGKPVMLDAYLFRATNANGPTPAVVFMHGCNGMLTRKGKIDSRELDWAHRFNALGYTVLAVDSFTSRGQASECRGGGDVRPSVERPRDAYGALRYLQQLPGIAPNRIALMGWSHGGGTVLFSVGPRGPGQASVATSAAVASAPVTAPDFAAAVAFLRAGATRRRRGRIG